MKASTLANALTLIRRLRRAAVDGEAIEFLAYYRLSCQCEFEIEQALGNFDVPIEKEVA